MAATLPPPSLELGNETLYAVIGSVAQGPDLDRVLPPIVELLTDATACHACFVYLVEGGLLRMRAASRIYARAVGRVTLRLEEGLCGWVVRHREPAFIREDALHDPRMKLVPELEEERFQSMVAVPLIGREDNVIGVVVLHTQAPREFGTEVLEFLVHVASLVAGAIDNARLYESSRRQVAALSDLTALAQRISGASGRGALYKTACDGVCALLEADDVQLALDADRRVVGADGPGTHRLSAAIAAGAEQLGLLVATRDGAAEPFDADHLRLLDAVAHQLAVALQKADLIERLTEENLVRALFDALADGRHATAEARALRTGHDLMRPHVVAVLEPLEPGAAGWAGAAARVEGRLRRAVPGTLCDVGDERLRVLLPAAGDDALRRIDDELRRIASDERIAAGRSDPRRGLTGDARSLSEAMSAVRVARSFHRGGGLAAYPALGAFRYLVPPEGGQAPDERHARAVSVLLRYDDERQAELVRTLERYLDDRCGVAQAARSLFVHPNTLRQRLERIEQLTDLVLADEDLLSLRLALLSARL
jgi:GAF domain-containing protein